MGTAVHCALFVGTLLTNIPCARGRARASARKAERQAEIHRMILSSGSLIRQTTTTVIPSDEREEKKVERMKGASPAACRVFRSLLIIITTFPTLTAAAQLPQLRQQ